VYYATQTLRQLLESRFADGKVMIPLVRVTDWPDMAQRGEGRGNAVEDIASPASYKMNRIDYHIRFSRSKNSPVRANKTGYQGVFPQRIEFARREEDSA